MSDADTDPVDRALHEIEASAEAKRTSGEIPADLEARLDTEFRDIVGTPPPPLDHVARLIGQLRDFSFEIPEPANSSSIPGGQLVHRMVSSTLRRHSELQAAQLQQLRDLVADTLDALERDIAHGLEELEERRRRAVSDLRAELAEGWRAAGKRSSAG